MKTVTLKYVQKYFDNGQIRSEEFLDSNGSRYNDNGPSFRLWYDNGQLQYESFRLNGILHNTEGPAIVSWSSCGELDCELYFITGVQLSKQEFEERNKKSQYEGRIVVIDDVSYKLQMIKE